MAVAVKREVIIMLFISIVIILFLGRENGLQHISQCEQQLNDILRCYLEKWKEEEQSKKKK